MLEVILALGTIVIVLACAGLSFGKGRSSGQTEVRRPSAKSVDGFGGALAADYTHSPTIRASAKPGLPVSLRLERKKTDTYAQSKGDEEDL